jgi:hypothetical protein
MTLGYLLFEDPEFGYFASDKVDDRVYWFLSNDQIKTLENIKEQNPTYGSLSFDETGYFIMREGWGEDDKMMVITAGLDDEKPDHQHGDMLGIQAIAHGHAILPNYQVRYALEDLDLFKNSMVKNVALVDDALQGKKWTSNKGGSGFGKFLELPDPEVIVWKVDDDFDFFAGRHDGFENVDVKYTRQVIFVKNEFWIVKDNFISNDAHNYKQVWQGHYTNEDGPDLLRATAPDATGHDILQLYETDSVFNYGRRGKQWSVVTKSREGDFSFLTIIYPYKGYNNRLDEEADKLMINNWIVNNPRWDAFGENAVSISNENRTYFFGVTRLKREKLSIEFSEKSDVYVVVNDGQAMIQSIGASNSSITIIPSRKKNKISKQLIPGEVYEIQ